MEKMIKFFDEKIFPSLLYLTAFFVILAFIVQVTFAVMSVFASEEKILDITHKMTWKFDGNYKDHPDNIFYEGS
jgi:hypothetical protein